MTAKEPEKGALSPGACMPLPSHSAESFMHAMQGNPVPPSRRRLLRGAHDDWLASQTRPDLVTVHPIRSTYAQ